MMNFYRCRHCGNIIAYLHDSGVKVVCCGEDMMKLVAHKNDDTANEKHVPVIDVQGSHVTVKVGSVEHPMTEAHYIEWIALETKLGHQRKELKFTDKPIAEFEMVEGDEVVAAFIYCNIHGLWSKEL